ncbi:hypothetical protein PMM47T1_20198 [Pseudomonas sp. M47T1]|uniref:hypothetical protein n=1 Tax=Pseudomonas sp. M47T1 TaxID=1179778 RepID=UPI0002606878|nr:hypothetical protein [Pseudomonas sp. M47T1]EIK94854.1 hypothetical protein PMM47T1_20198 [Pseudomonas sp. M47T1]
MAAFYRIPEHVGMDFLTFTLVGLFTGTLGGWAAFAFGTKTGKMIASSASLSAMALETDSALKGFMGYGHEPGDLVLTLSGAYVVGFFATLGLLTQLLLKQDSSYRITLIDVVFGNNKALDAYHDAKRRELDSLLDRELNIDALSREREALDRRQLELDVQARLLAAEREEAEALLQARDALVKGHVAMPLPLQHKHLIKPEFFELLPRQVLKVCRFHHALLQETERAVRQAPERDFAAYLMAVAGHLKEHLFDQCTQGSLEEVRVHFRRLEAADMTYKPYVVHGHTEMEVAAVHVDDGLIKASRQSRRSLVYSANKRLAIVGGANFVWQDYLVYAFDAIRHGDLPMYSLGISIRHRAAHSSLLYLISFLQLEQVIQHEMLRVHRAGKESAQR